MQSIRFELTANRLTFPVDDGSQLTYIRAPAD
jgi:hypothetical protein